MYLTCEMLKQSFMDVLYISNYEFVLSKENADILFFGISLCLLTYLTFKCGININAVKTF